MSVRRPDDLLVLDLTFHGFVLRDGPRLERAAPDAHVVVEFPPQSFGEEAWLQAAPEVTVEPDHADEIEVTSHPGYPPKNVPGTGATTPAELPAARVRMSGRSRVAIAMPAGTDHVAFDLAGMLAALRDWPMRLDGNAVPDPLLFGADLRHALDAAAEQLAIEALARATGGTSGTYLGEEIAREVTRLQGEFPALGDAGSRAAATAALSVRAAGALIEAGGAAAQVAAAPLHRLVFGPREPAPSVTALELPYRLVLSPIAPARWQHRDGPVERRGRTELWHTRLSTAATPAGPDRASRVRAIWSPDYRPQQRIDELIALLSEQPEPPGGPQPNPDLVRMSLDPLDRSMLVTLMAGFDATRDNGREYAPRTSAVRRLHLSALGALLDAEGTWETRPEGVDLQQWRHVATLGRDHYVRVMYAGFLCPFGHAASLVKVTERRFQPLKAGAPERVALLRQRFFVVVREPVRVYTGTGHEFGGRNFPFTRIEILTRVTPDLAEPGIGKSGLMPLPAGIAPRMLFWPMVPAQNADGLADVPFEIAATDLDGARSTFAMPLLFVGALADADVAVSKTLKGAYNATPAVPRRRAALGGAVVGYAPSAAAASDKGDPRLPTESVTFRAGNPSAAAHPDFHPEIDVAKVGVKAIQKLLGQPNFVVEVTYPEFYRKSGFDAGANAGRVYLQFTRAVPLRFGGGADQPKNDALGALASPQMDLLGLSTVMGPVAGKSANDVDGVQDALDTVKGGTFDPLAFFNQATVLGGITLGELLGLKHDLAADDVPKMVARDFPDRVEASFAWSTEITRSDHLNLMIPRADSSKPPTRLAMQGVVRTPRDPAAAAGVDADASLNNFKVNLFGCVILWFEQLTFQARNGRKPDVTVELRNGEDAVAFGGPLEFVNELRKVIPANGFSDPPALLVTPSGISASFTLNLPGIGVGIFALTNASLGASFSLPFDARPASVRFNFSERQHPFSLTVSLLGGGGFFAIGVSARGVNEIEAALEFGAAIVIDLGVASGGVEVKAGVYFHWLEPIPDKGSVELAGYIRIHGELTVLAIISVSLTFHLQLGYQKKDGQSSVYGEATLTVEIEILMFSAEVSVTCRREFAGAAADPRFLELVPTPQVWADYCGAFAEEVVA